MSERDTADHFDKQNAKSYDSKWKALAPFNKSLHLQLSLVMGELPEESRILVVGAGTGAELLALAERFPKWKFLAVDPSAHMLEICEKKSFEAGIADRCEFLVGFVHDIPNTKNGFDAATSILVSHFITNRIERLGFFQEIGKRLNSGGLLVTSDLSEAPRGQQAELMPVWLRMMAYAGATPEQTQGMLDAYKENVSMLTEESMEELLLEAGFENATLFSQSLLIRSWFARISSKT